MIQSQQKIESSIKFIHLLNMFQQKPVRESLSFKRSESHIIESRDLLCKHYRLNKSDLIKFLIKKESYILKQPHETWSYQWEARASVS